MANLFQEKPEIAPLVLPASFTCPVTGLSVPMTPDENLAYRIRLLTAAENDPDLQQDLYTACSQSIEFWVAAFVVTLRVFDYDEEGRQRQAENAHVPFLMWPVQNVLVEKLRVCIEEGEEILIDKSRDMGATWTILAVLTWFFLFRPDQSLLLISRKEDSVDQLDGQAKNYPYGPVADPGTLFGKIDYLISRLPEWMVPNLSRKKMHVVNQDNKSRIDGESANATAGSSDRRTAIFLDEFAKVDEAESIKRSTKDVTACRIVCSTPNGAGTTFSKWRLSGQIDVYALPWWENPDKGRDRYVRQDKMGRWQIRSPWYDIECDKRSPKEVSIELDMDHVGSGDQFFEPAVLDQHKKLFARPPRNSISIHFRKKLNEDEIAQAVRKMDTKLVAWSPGGPWKMWVDLVNKRPDQSKTYILSIDIGKGQGASNSVINVSCVETREKIAEFADANTPPYELARIACAAGIWFGGRSRRPLIIWENNGDPGFDFGRQLVHTYHYPNIFFDKAVGTLRQKVGKRYGWRSNTEKKAEALGLLRRCYAHGRYINRSEAALVEAASYISYEGGGIGPADLVNESDSTRKAHGDRVIADMLFVWALADAGRVRKVETNNPKRCFANRFKEFQKQKKADRRNGSPLPDLAGAHL